MACWWSRILNSLTITTKVQNMFQRSHQGSTTINICCKLESMPLYLSCSLRKSMITMSSYNFCAVEAARPMKDGKTPEYIDKYLWSQSTVQSSPGITQNWYLLVQVLTRLIINRRALIISIRCGTTQCSTFPPSHCLLVFYTEGSSDTAPQ